MSWISFICFTICIVIILSVLRKGADPFSPGRVFAFVWSFAIGVAELKLSALQHDWNFDGWTLLLTGIAAFLLGTFVAYVLNLGNIMVPVRTMRHILRQEEVREGRLFWLICLSFAVYGISYLVNFLVRGWLPIFVLAKNISRVDFNVSGLTLFIYSAAFIVFFTVLYHLLVPGKKGRKRILTFLSILAVGSYFLLLQRFHIIMTGVVCCVLLYYATRAIRVRTAAPFFLVMISFFYWISSLRFSHLAVNFLYNESKMKFPKDYAWVTEPYMYMVMNLENFARCVNQQDYHTYGYFTFDFVTAISGLKYWVTEYFAMERTPFLESGYNTYTAFYWFYSDFGVIGLALIPFLLGFGAGLLYYRMRINPTIKSVAAYGMMVFVIVISYFNFPIAFLWFEYDILAMYWILRLTMVPRKDHPPASVAPMQS